MMITMIDYGGSNIRSVQKAFEAIGAAVKVTDDPDEIIHAQKLVLPGVGAFGAGIDALRGRQLEEPVRERAQAGVPLLGICVGMQFLFNESEELGRHTGLKLVDGNVRRFPENGLKVPHIGWNRLWRRRDHPLLTDVPDGAYAYFVHSYFCDPVADGTTVARCQYGVAFPAIVARGNIMGLQFHPEKSQQVGLQILRNFVQRV